MFVSINCNDAVYSKNSHLLSLLKEVFYGISQASLLSKAAGKSN
jgi:hypothetical protein